MDKETLPDIRNKLTAPKIALEKLAKGEKLPNVFLELALKESLPYRQAGEIIEFKNSPLS